MVRNSLERLKKLVMNCGVPAIALTICYLLVKDKMTAEALSQLPDKVGAIPAWAWVGALAMTIASFWSVGRYDEVGHLYFRTGIPPQQARTTGAAAIALGQFIGFALVTSALARWRLLPEFSLGQALRHSAFVSVCFIVSWVALTSIVCVLLPAPDWAFWPGILGVVVTYALLFTLFFKPSLRFRGRAVHLPTLRHSANLLLWTTIDLTTASAALYFLLPPEHGLSFLQILPLFLIALGAALVSNTPGGIGPFEVTLMAAMPHIAFGDLLGSLLAFRIVYFVVPAIIAGLVLLRPFTAFQRPVRHDEPPSLADAPRSEVAVIRQNGGKAIHLLGAKVAIWPTGQTMTALFDPISGGAPSLMHGLRFLGRQHGRIPMVYKCSARIAAGLRYGGWSVLHLADDAVIDAPHYDTNIPARRTLRRKLRAAEKAGVRIELTPAWPWAELARVDAEWQARNGMARGGTMGRFSPDYVAGQWVALAKCEDRVVAFITCHQSTQEWCLDLMRSTSDAPDGTMHALVDTAIKHADGAGAARFNMAATPACPNPNSAFWRWAAVQATAFSKTAGLRQFKSNFAPQWEPRYAAAPGPVPLILGLCDVAREVIMPPPIQQDPGLTSNEPHNVDADYEVASARTA
ncbi:MAG: phosphatidylglycerol lysyltransferase domain-containing protein [Pseudomonadota bacterium]